MISFAPQSCMDCSDIVAYGNFVTHLTPLRLREFIPVTPTKQEVQECCVWKNTWGGIALRCEYASDQPTFQPELKVSN